MKQLIIILLISFYSCNENSKIIKFKINSEEYTVFEEGDNSLIEDNGISYGVRYIDEGAKNRYEVMKNNLDFLNDFSANYIQEFDVYLIKGNKMFEGGKQTIYHFYKKGNSTQSISIMAFCSFPENKKNEERIFEVVNSAHFY